ncbi:MAG: hypothetical protein UR69_C0001G0264 [Candidatus Moranbacteria bacterium GW2011_GWE2_35_2-]|nr:MAG: hypothetical protein UR69_C0001G0264 [Candidatus Moranbacteria bacterium GW2011_GWE2_35_2-]KKQ04059.1 MAG: hypothetical protein US15_C0069G0003 [Candidatus Moranbacteria bacterium GW2011_GWF1_36_4]KKQ22738.1 MAG: hypothetical protein US37_C0001G0010 [Candidatus Moranbacteria bacterium GW2011_GWF2_37_11]KKQ28892.1 MAG: hypothetical protein US44_C0005G0034 [Candidatus Moranbacteria bacterium GW2011_GWD1_37_17]KKQ31031.1 MAG: hypothetical protein US47_C0001G0264 [Candidatus Moranbacteria b
MSQNAINYIQANKDKFSKEVLKKELQKAGYTEDDIAQSLVAVYGGDITGDKTRGARNDFWNFKNKREYTASGEKNKDFFFGLISPFVLGFIPLVNFIAFPLEIFAIIYLFNRRRYISYGIMSSFALGLVFVVIIVVLIIFGRYFQ